MAPEAYAAVAVGTKGTPLYVCWVSAIGGGRHDASHMEAPSVSTAVEAVLGADNWDLRAVAVDGWMSDGLREALNEHLRTVGMAPTPEAGPDRAYRMAIKLARLRSAQFD